MWLFRKFMIQNSYYYLCCWWFTENYIGKSSYKFMDVKQAFEYAYETLSKPLLRDIDKTSDRQESVIIFFIKGLEAEVSQSFFWLIL